LPVGKYFTGNKIFKLEKRTMKRITKIVILLLLITAVPIGVVYAQEGEPLNRTIASGEVVNEDVAVYGGNLIIESGAMVNGEVLVFGGHAEVGGTIDGDVTVFGGNVELTGPVVGNVVIFGGNLEVGAEALVNGDCALLGGTVSGDGAAQNNCTSFGEEFPFPIGDFMGAPVMPTPPDIPAIPEIPAYPNQSRGIGGFFRDIGEAAGSSLMFGLLALIFAALLPNHLNQVSDVIFRKPVASGTVGVLTAMAGPFAIAMLALLSTVFIILCGLGLLGYPVVLVLSIALGFGFLMGWIAMGTLLGQRLAESMNLTNRSLPVVAALGTAILTLVIGVMSALPFGGEFFGGVLTIIIGSAGLGAVALTKFGTRTYPLGLSNEEKIAAVLETLPVEEAEAA
jgi:hypothetical protein